MIRTAISPRFAMRTREITRRCSPARRVSISPKNRPLGDSPSCAGAGLPDRRRVERGPGRARGADRLVALARIAIHLARHVGLVTVMAFDARLPGVGDL